MPRLRLSVSVSGSAIRLVKRYTLLRQLLKLLNGRNFRDSFPILTGGFENLLLAEPNDI